MGGAAELLVAEDHGLSASEEQGGDDVQLRHLLAQSLHVSHLHVPLPSLVESLVGLGRILRPDDGGVGGESGEVVLQYLLQSLSASHQGDEHKHAPEHAKSRQQAAALVPRDGIEYLFICI